MFFSISDYTNSTHHFSVILLLQHKMCFYFTFALGSTIICIAIIYVHILEMLHGSFAQAFLNVEKNIS